jgi:hypothetical protein
MRVSPARLAEYEGDYVFRVLDEGELIEQLDPGTDVQLEFYRDEYVLVVGDKYEPLGSIRANFVRGPDGRVAWLSFGGRPFARQG